MQKIYLADLKSCEGDLRKIETALEEEIPEYWSAKSVSISDDLKTAVMILEPIQGMEMEAIISDAAFKKRNLNIPIHEKVI